MRHPSKDVQYAVKFMGVMLERKCWAAMVHRFCLGRSDSCDCLKNHIEKDSETNTLNERDAKIT